MTSEGDEKSDVFVKQSEAGDSSNGYVSIFSSTENERAFELVCLELGNQNARRIFREIAQGVNTSSGLVEKTHLSLQDVLLHLDKLVSVGLVEKTNHRLSTLRGRKPTMYKVSRVAVLLIPEEDATVANRAQIREFIYLKSLSRLRKRVGLSVSSTALVGWLTFRLLLNYLISREAGSSLTKGTNSLFTLPPNVAMISELTAFLVTIALSVPFFLVIFKFSKRYWR